MENHSPVIAYKPCGKKDELKEENFLVVIMTDFQANMFAKFSTLGCVDSTHKTNEYGYKLITLLVIDEFRKGIPHKYCVSHKYYYKLFSSLKGSQ